MPGTLEFAYMKYAHIITALFAGTACFAQAADREDVCRSLRKGLESQVELLCDVQDANSAAAAVPELRRVLAELSALRNQVPEEQLWAYIDNTPGVKNELIECLLSLSGQLKRLHSANYYGDAGLRELLAPQISVGAVAP